MIVRSAVQIPAFFFSTVMDTGLSSTEGNLQSSCKSIDTRGVFRPRQSRELPRAVDLKGRLLSCQSY